MAAEVFIRKTTGFLLLLVAALVIACVALLVLVLSPKWGETQPVTADWAKSENLIQSSTQDDNEDVIDETSMTKSPSKESTSTKISTSTTTTTVKPQEPWEKDIRIPTTSLPVHYDLFLHPDLEAEWFTGRVTIHIQLQEPMSYLVTHFKEMNITSTSLKNRVDGSEVPLQDYFEYEPHQFWVVRPTKTLKEGDYSLTLEFNGNLKGHIVGFYKSEYKNKSGQKRSIATSKFQPTDARRAFPCFDEPSFKSTFTVTLIRPSHDYISLSNMPIKHEIRDSPTTGLTRVVFEKSVPMVTYLACFIVCDFAYEETYTKANKPFRVYSTKDQINRTHYSRDIGVHILNYFEEYFEIEYPLPKQDMIAIPDFSSGAMEHWGLITYRETNLLYDPQESSSYNKQRVASVVSHELAHMWFGNLVTLKWWDDLWLNEGFASYIEYKGVADYEKGWDMEGQFVISDLQTVFRLDEILSSHPIVQEVNHPDEITEIFDRISYSKGASVLRMLENFMGPEPFRIGIRNFLKTFKYGNAITQDLWDELQGVQQDYLNITRIMNTWTRQMGFPVVTVSKSVKRPGNYDVRQERFLIDSEAVSADDSPYGYKWDIPITFRTNEIKRQQIWFNMENDMVSITKPSNTQWIKLNVDQYGYYRVNYDQDLWNDLISLLKTNHQALSPSDRSSLIDDSFSLAAAKLLPYDTAFSVISYVKNETHYIPWSSVGYHIGTIEELLRNEDAYVHFKMFVLSLVGDHARRVGWEDTGSHLERRNRIQLLSLSCKSGQEFCLTAAVERFAAWIANQKQSIPPNLRTLAYYYGIKESGGYKNWKILLDRYIDETNAQEKLKMLRGLAATKEIWIANRFLKMARNESIVRRQDYFTAITLLARNPTLLSTVWDYIRTNWDWMLEEFGLNNRYLGRALRSIAFHFTTKLQLKELLEFYKAYPDAGSGKRGRVQAEEKVRKNIHWIEENSQHLGRWLQNNNNVV